MKKLLIGLLLVLGCFSISYSQEVILNNSPVQVKSQNEYGTEYVVFVDSGITAPKVYRGLSLFLASLDYGDTVVFKIITPGGSAYTSLMLYNDILKCKAKTIADIHVAYSGGSIIAMACEEMRLNILSKMLVHGYQTFIMDAGSVTRIRKDIDRMDEESKEAILKIYSNFLTKAQMEKVLDGIDLFLNEEDLKKLLKKWKPINIKDRSKLKKKKPAKEMTKKERKEEMDRMIYEMLQDMKKRKEQSNKKNW